MSPPGYGCALTLTPIAERLAVDRSGMTMSKDKRAVAWTQSHFKNPFKCDLEIKDNCHTEFMNVHDTSSHGDTPMCQTWYTDVKAKRSYRLDPKNAQTDTPTDRHTEWFLFKYFVRGDIHVNMSKFNASFHRTTVISSFSSHKVHLAMNKKKKNK